MFIDLRAVGTQKAGNDWGEYEDALWPQRRTVSNISAFRCAVADGATETSFAATWARLLVRAYCRDQMKPKRFPRAISELARDWSQQVGGRPLPWYAEEKMRDGAFSTLVGLSLQTDSGPSPPGGDRLSGNGAMSWHAMAIGDSCLFQVRNDELVCSFPITESTGFNSRPRLVSTNPSRNGDLTTLASRATGDVLQGDRFLLMTDALAAWFLGQYECGAQPWNEPAWCADDVDFCQPGSFAEWISELRGRKEIRNDDVTLQIIHVG